MKYICTSSFSTLLLPVLVFNETKLYELCSKLHVDQADDSLQSRG